MSHDARRSLNLTNGQSFGLYRKFHPIIQLNDDCFQNTQMELPAEARKSRR